MFDPADPVTGGYDQAILQDVQRTQMQLNMTLAQFQLNFKEEVERFDMLLRGVVKDNKTGEIKQVYKQIVNERGRAHIMKKIRTWMSKTVAQSDYDENMILAWCRVYSKELLCDAAFFGDYWDLETDEYTSFVNDCCFTIYTMMSAARNGGLREVIGKISKVVESYAQAPDRKRGLIP